MIDDATLQAMVGQLVESLGEDGSGVVDPEHAARVQTQQAMAAYRGTQGAALMSYLAMKKGEYHAALTQETSVDSMRQLQGALMFIELMSNDIG